MKRVADYAGVRWVFVEYRGHKEKEECGQIHFSCVECSTTIPRLDYMLQ